MARAVPASAAVCSGEALGLGMVMAMMLVLTLYRFEGFSRGVFAIDAGVAWLLLVGSRAATSGIQHYLRRQHTLVAVDAHLRRRRRRQAGASASSRRTATSTSIRSASWTTTRPSSACASTAFPVLGTLDDLERLAAAWGVTDVIVSARNIDPERLEALRVRSGLLGIRVRRMRLDLDELRPAAKVLRR